MEEYRKPLPRVTDLTRPFWDGAKNSELLVQTCRRCGSGQYPPRPVCLQCWSDELEWKRASGGGTIYSHTTAYRTSTKGFREDTPYVVAIVELDEGPRMVTNVVGCAPDDVHVGQAVRAVFHRATDDITLVKFTPVTSKS
jgi:uncharacterized OB-fold protein